MQGLKGPQSGPGDAWVPVCLFGGLLVPIGLLLALEISGISCHRHRWCGLGSVAFSTYACTCIDTNVYVHKGLYVCIYVHIYIHYIYIYICNMYVYIYICIYIYTYVCACVDTYLSPSLFLCMYFPPSFI